jgi:hypothetical protein
MSRLPCAKSGTGTAAGGRAPPGCGPQARASLPSTGRASARAGPAAASRLGVCSALGGAGPLPRRPEEQPTARPTPLQPRSRRPHTLLSPASRRSRVFAAPGEAGEGAGGVDSGPPQGREDRGPPAVELSGPGVFGIPQRWILVAATSASFVLCNMDKVSSKSESWAGSSGSPGKRASTPPAAPGQLADATTPPCGQVNMSVALIPMAQQFGWTGAEKGLVRCGRLLQNPRTIHALHPRTS